MSFEAIVEDCWRTTHNGYPTIPIAICGKVTDRVNVLKFWTLVAWQKGLGKQLRPRSHCFWRSSLIRAFPVCYFDKHFVNFSSVNLHFIWEQKKKSVCKCYKQTKKSLLAEKGIKDANYCLSIQILPSITPIRTLCQSLPLGQPCNLCPRRYDTPNLMSCLISWEMAFFFVLLRFILSMYENIVGPYSCISEHSLINKHASFLIVNWNILTMYIASRFGCRPIQRFVK